jgi:predicted Rossmann-fold nucleotide-binding protein
MTSVARAFVEGPRTAGISIGILPCADADDRAHAAPGYPNPFVELVIRTHLPFSGELGAHDLSRNHINVLTAHAIVALPGGSGTASEVALAKRYGTPVIVYSLDTGSVSHYIPAATRAANLADVEAFLRQAMANAAARRAT